MRRITFDPLRDVVVKELLAPNHSSQSLPLNKPLVAAWQVLLELTVEFISALTAGKEELVEIRERLMMRWS